MSRGEGHCRAATVEWKKEHTKKERKWRLKIVNKYTTISTSDMALHLLYSICIVFRLSLANTHTHTHMFYPCNIYIFTSDFDDDLLVIYYTLDTINLPPENRNELRASSSESSRIELNGIDFFFLYIYNNIYISVCVYI